MRHVIIRKDSITFLFSPSFCHLYSTIRFCYFGELATCFCSTARHLLYFENDILPILSIACLVNEWVTAQFQSRQQPLPNNTLREKEKKQQPNRVFCVCSWISAFRSLLLLVSIGIGHCYRIELDRIVVSICWHRPFSCKCQNGISVIHTKRTHQIKSMIWIEKPNYMYQWNAITFFSFKF